MAFKITRIPSDRDNASAHMEAYKTFRLLSLKSSPEAFASTYEREVEFTDEVWLARLTNPLAATLNATQDDEIVCMLTILGPLGFRPEELAADVNPWVAKQSTEVSEAHYRFNGMFTLPAARGQGIARALILHGLEYGKMRAEEVGKKFVGSIVVEKDNGPARALYEKCGFRVLREEEYVAASGRTQMVLLMAAT